ncbi:MAG TPA: fructosamine kinase family protein [Kofleriaceae bacterium]|nr:fructosamine kinase family protein [Kofleriaceae bacterium]
MTAGQAGEGWEVELAEALGARAALAEPVAGGDINDAYRVQLDDGRVVFVKTHAHPPPGMFEAEARGLDWLRAGPLRVPRVLCAGERFLALEWLTLGGRGRGFDEALGRGLAALHRVGAPAFGLDRDGYLATLPQPRGELADGPTFWIEHRVRPLAERARAAGRMPDVSARLDALLARRDRFGPPEPPARLHGDLWWGNVAAAGGAPALIDPAVYGGHREVDLAMLALFGGLPEPLVRAYDEVYPLAPGWRERRLLWQLYPLAAHAVLFGGGYGAQVAQALGALT